MVALGMAMGLVIGLLLGLLGGGGSILTVPVFVYLLGLEPKTAIAMSLPAVGLAALAASWAHWKAGRVQFKLAAGFGGVAMLGSFAGAQGARWLSDSAQLLLFAVIMLVAATLMLVPRREAGDADGKPVPWWRMGVSALGVGLLTGLVGIGGGFLIVPALVLWGHLAMKAAVGTSLVVIAMNALSGTLGYMGQVDFQWGLLAGFTLLSILGTVAGATLVRYVPQAALKRGFAVFLLGMGSFILYQNRLILLAMGWVA